MAGILKPTTFSQQKPAPIAASDTSKRTTLASAGASLATKPGASTISKAQTHHAFHDPYLPMPRLPRPISDSGPLSAKGISVDLQDPAKKETAKKEAPAYEFELEEDLPAIGGSFQQVSKEMSRADIDEFIGQKASMNSFTRVKNIGAASVQTSFGAGFAARQKFMASKLPAPAKERDADTATSVASAAMSKDSARGERAKESPLRKVFALSHSASPSASKSDDKNTKSPSPTNPSLEPASAVSGLKYTPSSRSSQFARPAHVAAKPAESEIENDSDDERPSSPSVVVVVEASESQSKKPDARKTPISKPGDTFARLKAPSLEDTSLELPHTPPRPKFQPSPLSAQSARTTPVIVKPALAAASAEVQIDAEIENDSDNERSSSPSVVAVPDTLELESAEPVARKTPIYIPGDNVDILIINDD